MSRGGSALQKVVGTMAIRVTNRFKWARFKRRLAFTLFVIGALMTLSLENENTPMHWGYIGIVFAMLGAFVVGTIRHDEW